MVMEGGFSAVAAVMNDQLAWPDGRWVSRQQVEAWARRGTVNHARQLPPSPVRENPAALRTVPRLIYDPAAWVAWALPGVPGPRRRGWVYPTRAQDGT